MKSFQYNRTVWVAGIVGAMGLACFATPSLTTAQEKHGKADGGGATVAARAALTVSTVTPEATEWSEQLTASGSIAAWQEAIVGSEIGGLRLADVPVNVGDRVRKGQVIGLVGATGRVTGPHLHLSLLVQGESVDPQPFLTTGNARGNNP